MRKLRDVLRLRHAAGLSIRDISRSTKLSVGGIQKLLSRAQGLHLGWPLPADLDDTPVGPTVLSRRRYRQQSAPPGSGLAGSSPGAEAAACDQTAVVGRIYPALPEPVLQLFPVL